MAFDCVILMQSQRQLPLEVVKQMEAVQGEALQCNTFLDCTQYCMLVDSLCSTTTSLT